MTNSNLSFSKIERIAIIILFLGIIVLQSMTLFINPQVHNSKVEISKLLLDTIKLDTIMASDKKNETLIQVDTRQQSKEENVVEIKNIVALNPNTMNSLQMKTIGFSQYLTNNILKYRSKGGYFKSCQDLKKIYGMDSMHFNRFEKYCSIDEAQNKKTSQELININFADTTLLKTIKGIGSVYSKRIIKYRNNIGGFHSVEQLKEVYGIDEDLYNRIKSRITVSGELKKLKINHLDKKALARHYYIDWSLANHIVSFRSQHGSYQNEEALKKIKTLNDSIYEKIVPYLDFDLTNMDVSR